MLSQILQMKSNHEFDVSVIFLLIATDTDADFLFFYQRRFLAWGHFCLRHCLVQRRDKAGAACGRQPSGLENIPKITFK
jgi:hypothetical protein